ncbi:MAG TPA: CapA family protein [Roseomonas sp.]|nr:CapA family protein [Roseomonas sp.]
MIGRRALVTALAGAAAPRSGAAQAGVATIAFLGDIMLGGDVGVALARHPPEWLWGDALPVLQAADAAIANLEAPLTEAGLPQSRTPKWHHFRAAPAAVAVLRAAGIRAVCLANNHVLDYREAGLAETRRVLAEAQIAAVGAGQTLAEAAAPAILDLPRLRIGLVGATDALSAYAAGPDRAGVNRIEIRGDSAALPGLAGAAAAMDAAGVRLRILSLHWGPNFRRLPFDRSRAFARAALAAGFDVIHGHSAHILHGVEAIGRGVVLYDTGNAIDDYWDVPFFAQDWGCIFLLDLQEGRPVRLRLVPILTRPWPIRLPTGRQRQAMQARMRRASTGFGTRLRETPEGLELHLATGGG